MNSIIEEKLKLLPSSPGVYKMFNAAGEVIYVGKAISLKNRVRQYFQSSKNHPPKVTAMVRQIADFEYIRVANETEAFSLESNLIKEFKPKYNILLKDDKHFPYIRVDLRQDFPRLEVVRRVKKDGAKYLGPFLSGLLLRDGLALVREQYPIRQCKKDISRMIARRERPCLMYHIGKCCAPCSGEITREEYHKLLDEVLSFLSGNTSEILRSLNEQMDTAAESMDFERAAILRDRIRAIESLNEKQAVIATTNTMLDVFALGRLETNALVFALFVRNGKVIGTEKFRMDADIEESDADILSAFLSQYYAESATFVPEVLLYQDASDMEAISEWLGGLAKRKVEVHRPQRGEKRRLTEMAYRNCLDVLEKDASLQKRAWERGEGALTQLSAILGLETVPSRIECFDNSHIQGRDTVSSMVVFTDGQPDKSAYRRFRIRAEANGNDLIAMREALMRRFQKAEENEAGFLPLPDLLVMDGGPTQLQVALEVLDHFSLDFIPTVGLAELSETIYIPNEALPIALPRNSAPQHLIERLRDEAHRFAISYHRNVHNRNALYSVLDDVPGVGDKRKRSLFDAFMTLDAIKSATIDELKSVPLVDSRTAETVYQYFHKQDQTDTDHTPAEPITE
ncbi:MAG: excinuclease ABC subunit UvrC [Eubacteriales bacterium]|nr:excinuclease ABC subunit UvrC [Eubacteriales bacterium]